MWQILLRRHDITCLFTPERKPKTDPSSNCTTVLLGQCVLVRVRTGIWVNGYWKGMRMTQKQLHHQKAYCSTGCDSQKLQPWSPLGSLQTSVQKSHCCNSESPPCQLLIPLIKLERDFPADLPSCCSNRLLAFYLSPESPEAPPFLLDAMFWFRGITIQLICAPFQY